MNTDLLCTIGVFFFVQIWSKAASMVGKRLTRLSEIHCALACRVDPNYFGYYFEEFNASLHDEKLNQSALGNCLLLERQHFDTQTPIPYPKLANSIIRCVIQIGAQIYTTSLTPSVRKIVEVSKIGFDKVIEVGKDMLFFKEIVSQTDYFGAMKACLSEGGILPMEDSDEFVDQMSILYGDAITPRFISLAQEVTLDNTTKSLVWTLGKRAWTDGESVSKCPQCVNWDFDGPRYPGAKIDPVSKLYEPLTSNDVVAKFFCQYLGGNLALDKNVMTSSQVDGDNRGGKWVVDGIVGESEPFWHSDAGYGQWITIDLGAVFVVRNVVFLGRLDVVTFRNRNMTVWMGQASTNSGASLNTTSRVLCASYPYAQLEKQLSGVTCTSICRGQFLTIQNDQQAFDFMHFAEIVVFGSIEN